VDSYEHGKEHLPFIEGEVFLEELISFSGTLLQGFSSSEAVGICVCVYIQKTKTETVRMDQELRHFIPA
jgi:hypothetical protein